MSQLVFGKYEIQHRLAIGGMGEVFYALQKGVPGFERPVILKSLLPELAKEEGFIESFLDEARVAATLNHPNVVSIFEVGQWNGTYYLAMEYIRGRNLAQVMRRALDQQQRVPPMVAVRIVRDAALGLDHAHRATDANGQALHIVHRDISPQNIMVRDDGLTKVVDFGIARATNRASRTATGALKGKLAYMAPEQVLGGDVGPRADQFALGVVLWEMLSHQRLFKAERDLDVVKKVLEEPIPPPVAQGAPLPAELVAVVMRMLERNADKRFPSCAEAALALETVATRFATADDSPKAFMRSLGTDDLVVKVMATPDSAGNFVISLKGKREDQAGEVSVMTGTPIVGHVSARPRRRRWLALAVLSLSAVGLAGWLSRDRSPVTPTQAEPPAAPDTLPPPLPEPAPRLVDPPTPPAPARLAVTTIPPKASVRVDGKPLDASPVEVEITPSTPHYLLVERSGYRRVEQTVTAEPGELKALTVKLEPEAKGRPAPAPALPAVTGPGFLSLNTTPWTKVSLDGEPLGSTPIFRKKLEAGPHVLELVNEGASVAARRTIDIKPGETLKLDLQLP